MIATQIECHIDSTLSGGLCPPSLQFTSCLTALQELSLRMMCWVKERAKTSELQRTPWEKGVLARVPMPDEFIIKPDGLVEAVGGRTLLAVVTKHVAIDGLQRHLEDHHDSLEDSDTSWKLERAQLASLCGPEGHALIEEMLLACTPAPAKETWSIGETVRRIEEVGNGTLCHLSSTVRRKHEVLLHTVKDLQKGIQLDNEDWAAGGFMSKAMNSD